MYGEEHRAAYRRVDTFPKKGKLIDVPATGGDDMILCNSDEDESSTHRDHTRWRDSREKGGKSSRSKRERERSLRVVPIKISPDAIRDGIVYIDESYYDFLRRYVDNINTAGKKGQKELKMIETVSDATIAERSRICLPSKLEPYRDRLLHCDVCIEGLPAAVFFGSGFGARNYEARASASKDLIDKCLRLGIVSQNMHAAIGVKPDLNRKTRLPHFNNSIKAMNLIIEFMNRETWPQDVMTARELEPKVIDKLKKVLDKAVKRAYMEDEKSKAEQSKRPINSKQEKRDSLSGFCSNCQIYGHTLEVCPELMQKRVVSQAEIEAKIQLQREELMRREQDRSQRTHTDDPSSLGVSLGYPIASNETTRPPYNGPSRYDVSTVDPYTYTSAQYTTRPGSSIYARDSYPTSYCKTEEEILREKEQEIRRKVEQEMELRREKIEEEVRERIRKEEREKIEAELRLSSNLPAPYNGPISSEPFASYGTSSATAHVYTERGHCAPQVYGLGTSFGLLADHNGRFFFAAREYATNPAQRRELDGICQHINEIERMLERLEKGGESVIDEGIRIEMMRAVHEMGNQAKGLDRVQQFLMLSQLKSLLQQALDEREERKMQRMRQDRFHSSSQKRSRSRSRSPAITYLQVGDMQLRSLDSRERLLLGHGQIKGCTVWAQDMKTGKWHKGVITKVSNRGRVIMQVGIAEWRKEPSEIYVTREMRF